MMGKAEDDRVRTVECLRGRLQAERVASKAAKDEAENLAKRLEELEKKLAEEIKCRNRAERRLKHVLKKLESLKLFDDKNQLELPVSSASSTSSQLDNRSSDGAKSGSPSQESRQCGSLEEVKEMQMSSGSEDILRDDVNSGSSSVGLPHQFVSQEDGSWSSIGTAQSHFEDEPRASENSEDVNQQEPTNCSLRECSSSVNEQEEVMDEVEIENNMLALVPVSKHLCSKTCAPQNNKNVESVLLALKNVREQLLYSMGRRSDIYTRKEFLACQRYTFGASSQCHGASY